jgi:hypothetical protein
MISVDVSKVLEELKVYQQDTVRRLEKLQLLKVWL